MKRNGNCSPDHENEGPSASGAGFDATPWSNVLAAAETPSLESEAALQEICIAYWKPIYAYLRRSGHKPHEAEDLTQDFFFTRVVNKRIFRGVQPGAGRFRSWLLTSLKNMVGNERDKILAAKRGGGQEHLTFDFESVEGCYAAEPSDHLTPEKFFDRHYAHQLLNLAMGQFEEAYRREGKADEFEELKCFLPGNNPSRTYAEVASRMNISEDAVKKKVSRFRKEYGQFIREEVKRTLADPRDVDEELRHLRALLTE